MADTSKPDETPIFDELTQTWLDSHDQHLPGDLPVKPGAKTKDVPTPLLDQEVKASQSKKRRGPKV